MKTYRVYAKYTNYCYIDVEAENAKEAYEKADEIDGGEYITDNCADSDWNLYDCEEL